MPDQRNIESGSAGVRRPRGSSRPEAAGGQTARVANKPSRRPDVGPHSVTHEKPQKTAMLVAQRIVREIFADSLSSGDQLAPEHKMLETYGIGRGTLKEALRYLELQGVITLRPGPGGGPVVSQPDSRHLAGTMALLLQFADTSFRSVIEARQIQEPAAARLAAQRISASGLEELHDSVRLMGEHVGDRERFLIDNSRFHDLVAWGSGNQMIGYLINSLHWITDGTVLGTDYPIQFRQIVLRAHEKIAEAIAAADAEAAQAAMQEHMDNALVYFERYFPDLLDRKLSWEHYAQ